MFLVFALLLLSLGIGMFLSMYSVFFPFFQQVSHITDYNAAYYSAISSIERASLVLKYRAPGFQGSGGFLGTATVRGPHSDWKLAFLTGSTQGSSRQILSRTQTIPSSGAGNTDLLLQTGDSSSYNVLGYNTLESFLLSYDNTTDKETYYTGVQVMQNFSSNGSAITGILRLPKSVYAAFGGNTDAQLCSAQGGNAGSFDCDLNQDGLYDEVKVNWSIDGLYNGSPYSGVPFKIVPTSDVFYYGGMQQVNYPYDSTIRASLLNATNQQLLLTFGGSSSRSPLVGSSLTGLNLITSIDSSQTDGWGFSSPFNGSVVSGLQLSLGLISPLRSANGNLYPYLEYKFVFPQPIADRFYTLDAHGRNANYDVEILIKKPTVNRSIGGDFTIIF